MTAPQANLAAQIGMAVLNHGVQAWFGDGTIDLGEHIVKAFQEAHDLSSSNMTTAKENRIGSKPPGKRRATLR
ncbi:hypothetical protein [Granulicella sp. L60]|uniref:hypothetical protein n=1 Tax=Granulicella sp. L60 TaxID=1641866 RepID=UPI0015775A1D|nr:hypothetical protein [Granulicella sp. L60]